MKDSPPDSACFIDHHNTVVSSPTRAVVVCSVPDIKIPTDYCFPGNWNKRKSAKKIGENSQSGGILSRFIYVGGLKYE